MKLEKLKPLQNTTNLSILKLLIPHDKTSMIDVIALISRLMLYSIQIIRGEKKETKFITAQNCHNQACALCQILKSYEIHKPKYKELQKIKKEFKIRFD